MTRAVVDEIAVKARLAVEAPRGCLSAVEAQSMCLRSEGFLEGILQVPSALGGEG